MNACLDSWAVLAWLDGLEPAFTRLEATLARRPVMSWLNAVEVSYRVERRRGPQHRSIVVRKMRSEMDLELPGTARMIEAAALKARMPIALGDCFAIATAAARGLPLLTGDPEILERDDLPCTVEDLRPH